MSPLFKTVLGATILSFLSLAQAQVEASFLVQHFSDLGCTAPIGLDIYDVAIGTAPGVPFEFASQVGAFGSAIIQSTTNIQTLAMCEHGCECSQSGCLTFNIPSTNVGECVSTNSLVDGNGNVLFPGVQFDKFSVTVI